MATPHLRWGILGTGNIAGKFADDLATIRDRATLQAVGSRDAGQAQAFARRHGAAAGHGSYDELLADPAVDVVYISLLNDQHAEWAIRAARAGKHILCEKPATMTADELEAVLAAVRTADVFFMEAYAYRCHARCERLRALIDDGAIGRVRMLHAVFAFDGSAMDRPRLWTPQHGGGALMDVGVYPVSWLRMVARFAGAGEPLALRALGQVAGGVDEWAGGVLGFAGGITGTFATAVRCVQPSSAAVYGEQGWIEVLEPWKCPPGSAVHVIHRAGAEAERVLVDDGLALYAREALTVADHVASRQAPACTWQDSLGQMRAIDALRAELGVRWPAEAGAVRR